MKTRKKYQIKFKKKGGAGRSRDRKKRKSKKRIKKRMKIIKAENPSDVLSSNTNNMLSYFKINYDSNTNKFKINKINKTEAQQQSSIPIYLVNIEK